MSSKIVLPTIINPPRIRKDGSASISFDTRELSSEELYMIMSLRNLEGWLCFAPNEGDLAIPEDKAEVEGKTPSERLRNVLYVWYKQETEAGRYAGLFESFKNDKMEKIIDTVKSKLIK